MVLGSTQSVTEMSTRSISWGKGGRCIRLTTYRHLVPLSRNLGTLTSWNPLDPSGPVMELLYLYLGITKHGGRGLLTPPGYHLLFKKAFLVWNTC